MARGNGKASRKVYRGTARGANASSKQFQTRSVRGGATTFGIGTANITSSALLIESQASGTLSVLTKSARGTFSRKGAVFASCNTRTFTILTSAIGTTLNRVSADIAVILSTSFSWSVYGLIVHTTLATNASQVPVLKVFKARSVREARKVSRTISTISGKTLARAALASEFLLAVDARCISVTTTTRRYRYATCLSFCNTFKFRRCTRIVFLSKRGNKKATKQEN